MVGRIRVEVPSRNSPPEVDPVGYGPLVIALPGIRRVQYCDGASAVAQKTMIQVIPVVEVPGDGPRPVDGKGERPYTAG